MYSVIKFNQNNSPFTPCHICRADDNSARVSSLQSEIVSFEAKIKQIQSQLDIQREKNDVSCKDAIKGSIKGGSQVA